MREVRVDLDSKTCEGAMDHAREVLAAARANREETRREQG